MLKLYLVGILHLRLTMDQFITKDVIPIIEKEAEIPPVMAMKLSAMLIFHGAVMIPRSNNSVFRLRKPSGE